ncbi:MAG: hypothetical protein ACLQDY_14195 [Streptosporangiaceae bacterium]
MSSALLYLAIVAIWAVFLIPRWIRRPHMAQEAAASPAAGPVDAAEPQEAAGPGEVEFIEQTEPVLAAEGGYHEADDFADEDEDLAGDGEEPPAQAPPWPGRGRLGSWHAVRDRVQAAVESRPAAAAQPPLSRARILQARRRMLATLVVLAAVAFSCYAAKLAPWWVCVPPASMLGMYLLLLREAALADAEQARWRAEQAALRIRAARQRARQEWIAWQEWAEQQPEPEPSAEIIDISGRVGDDQFYDQYADPPARAIGD